MQQRKEYQFVILHSPEENGHSFHKFFLTCQCTTHIIYIDVTKRSVSLLHVYRAAAKEELARSFLSFSGATAQRGPGPPHS
jgi:hypothetical protein